MIPSFHRPKPACTRKKSAPQPSPSDRDHAPMVRPKIYCLVKVSTIVALLEIGVDTQKAVDVTPP